MDWHTEVEEDSKEETETPIEETGGTAAVTAEEDLKDSKPEYKDYRTWKDIPDKDRKHYGI